MERPFDTEATMLANHCGREMHEAHRGAFLPNQLPETRFCCVFGNDGYSAPDDSKPGGAKIRREVELLREKLREHNIEEVGFGIDTDDGYSWAMLVECVDADWLHEVVWDCWDELSGFGDGSGCFRRMQSDLARSVVSSHFGE